jgi:hypothetical protein
MWRTHPAGGGRHTEGRCQLRVAGSGDREWVGKGERVEEWVEGVKGRYGIIIITIIIF